MIRGPARGFTNIVFLHLLRRMTRGIALVVLPLWISLPAIADTRSGLASTCGLVNHGFESGAAPWVITTADVGLVAGTETSVFFFNDAATPEIYTLSLHDALPI